MNILLIVIFFILLVFIFYSFNFYRYFNFYFNGEKNKNEYIKNFAKKPRIKTKSKIIVSITCKPCDINNLMPMLISILDQNTRIDGIALNIPYKTRHGETYDNIPDCLKDIVSIYRCHDYGKQNNIIPTLLRESEYGTIIISLDEKVVYGKTFIKKLLKQSLMNNNRAIFFNEGMLVKPEFFSTDILYEEKEIPNIKRYIKAQSMLFEYYENYRVDTFPSLNTLLP